MNIQGKWTGIITYGKEYGKWAGNELFFDVEIIQNGSEIAGVAIDTGGIGVSPDPAQIKGTFIENNISFVKQYASFNYFTRDGTKIDKSRPGSEINYSGEYNENENTFTGGWQIRGKVKLLGFIPIKYAVTGTWNMERKISSKPEKSLDLPQ